MRNPLQTFRPAHRKPDFKGTSSLARRSFLVGALAVALVAGERSADPATWLNPAVNTTGVGMADAVAMFGFVGDNSTANDTAMAALLSYANANTGWGAETLFFFRPGRYLFANTYTISGNNIQFIGSGAGWDPATGTCFRYTGNTGNFLTITGDGFKLSGFYFFPTKLRSSGFEIYVNGASRVSIKECTLEYIYCGIGLTGAYNTVWIEKIYMAFLYGPQAVYSGQSTGQSNILLLRDVCVQGSNFPTGGPPVSVGNNAGIYAVSHAYTVGQCIYENVNGLAWQCTSAGTSSGAFPTFSPSTSSSTALWSDTVTTGGCSWQLMCNDSLSCLWMDSGTNSVTLDHFQVIGSFNGIRVIDTYSSGNVQFLEAFDCEIDYPFSNGVQLDAGNDLYFGESYLCTSLAGSAFSNSGGFGGGLIVVASRLLYNSSYAHANVYNGTVEPNTYINTPSFVSTPGSYPNNSP